MTRTSSGGVAIRHVTSGFMDDVIFAHSGSYGCMSIQLQRLTSLRRREQAVVPIYAASFRPIGCVVSWTAAGADTIDGSIYM